MKRAEDPTKKDRFSQKDLDRLHQIGRKLYRMEHIDGVMRLVNRIDKNGTLGLCKPNYARNAYEIKILNPDLVPEDVGNDVLDTVLHELAHAKYFWLSKVKLSKLEQEHHEAMINDIAGIICRLYRGQ